MVVLDAGGVVPLLLEDAPVGVVAQAALAPSQLLLDPRHPVVVLLRRFLRERIQKAVSGSSYDSGARFNRK